MCLQFAGTKSQTKKREKQILRGAHDHLDFVRLSETLDQASHTQTAYTRKTFLQYLPIISCYMCLRFPLHTLSWMCYRLSDYNQIGIDSMQVQV